MVEIGEALRLLAFVRERREGDAELAVGVEIGRATGDRLRLGRAAGEAPPTPPPGELRLAGHAPGDAAGGDRQAEVVARLAAELGRAVEAELGRRRGYFDFERRPLVLLHTDRGRPAERALQRPLPEEPAGGNRELARRGAEAVGRDRGLRHLLAVRIGQPDGDGRPRRGREGAAPGAARIAEDLPVELLLRPVDRPIGEQQGAGLGGRRGLEVAAVALRGGDVAAAASHQQEVHVTLAGAAREGEGRPARSVGARGGDRRRRLAPGVAIEGDLDARGRAPVGALDQPHLPREGLTLLHQHQMRLGEGQRHPAVRPFGERGLRRSDDQIEAGVRERRCRERAVGHEVRGGRQRDRPRGRRLAARDELLDLALVVGEQTAELRARELLRQVDGIGAQEELRQIAMRDRDRPAAGAVDRHHLQGEVGGFDLRPQLAAELGAVAPGIGLLARRSELARPDPVFGVAAVEVDLAGELRRADRPPRIVAEARQASFEIGAQTSPIVRRLAVPGEQALTRQARLELGGELVAPAVPAFEIGEHGGGTQQRMHGSRAGGRRKCRRRGHRWQGGLVGKEVAEVELPGVVRFGGRPEGGVGEQPVDEEVAHGIAQRAAHTLGIVVGVEIRKVVDRHFRQLRAALPDGEEAPLGLGGDLLGGPRLEVELLVRDDALALADLPVVAREILEQSVGIVELDRGAGG